MKIRCQFEDWGTDLTSRTESARLTEEILLAFRIAQQFTQHGFAAGQEHLCDLVVIGLFVGDGLDAAFGKLIDR